MKKISELLKDEPRQSFLLGYALWEKCLIISVVVVGCIG